MAEGEAIIGKCTKDDGGVDNILFKGQQPHIEPLKPHQMSILCKASMRDNFKTYPPSGPSILENNVKDSHD